ncbi:hypothetical protein I7824_07055 [Burkholderia seminalis]|nr:hypothetical protein [Burkholderia seminalis]
MTDTKAGTEARTKAGMKPMRRDTRRIDPLIIRTPRADAGRGGLSCQPYSKCSTS